MKVSIKSDSKISFFARSGQEVSIAAVSVLTQVEWNSYDISEQCQILAIVFDTQQPWFLSVRFQMQGAEGRHLRLGFSMPKS